MRCCPGCWPSGRSPGCPACRRPGPARPRRRRRRAEAESPPPRAIYVARRFLGSTLAMLAGLTLLVALFDFIELLRRAATRPDAGFALVAQIAALRVPFVVLQILPFAILLGGLLAFW